MRPSCFLLLLVSCSFAAHAQDSIHFEAKSHYRKAVQEFEAKNVDAGLAELLKAAEGGYPLAQGRLGTLYRTGEYVKQDYNQALIWLTKAAENGDVDSMDYLGWMFENGKGVKVDFLEAMRWYNKSDQLGSTYGTCHLGVIYKNGKGTQKDLIKAVSLFQKCAFLNDARCQYYFGLMLDFGYGIKQDEEQANNWYRKGAEQGNDDAQFNLGWNYENGHGIAKNELEAATWYSKAAKQGNENAQFNLGLMYVDGRGVKANYSEAATLFRQAADQGSMKAKYQLALLYEGGNGVEKDLTTALRMYREAGVQGHVRSESQLGYLLVFGDSTIRNVKEGVDWLKKAAAQGSARAQYNLGRCYASGRGVEKNNAIMIDLFQKSADQDYSYAQLDLGVMYYEGKLIEKNVVEAVKHFKKAADQGNEQALRNIKIIYERKDIKEKVGIPSLDSLLFLPLKHDLDANDRSAIRALATSCFAIQEHFSIQFDVHDLLPDSGATVEEPASLLRAGELLKKLQEKPDDFKTCFALASVYLKLHKYEDGNRYLDKAEAIARNNLVTNPSDNAEHQNLAYVFIKRESYAKALEELDIFSRNDTEGVNVESTRMLCYLGLGDMKQTKAYYSAKITQDPRDHAAHLLLVASIIMQNLRDGIPDIKNKTVEEIADFSLLSNATKKYPEDLKLKFLLEALRHITLIAKIAFENGAKESIIEYQLTEYDRQELIKLEKFYLSSLSKKELENKFLSNKLLAGLYLFLNQYDNTIKYSRIALDIQSQKKPNDFSKSPELYDLLSTAYLLRKDTLMAQQIILEKIGQEKVTYQSADDYAALARFSLWKRDKSKANEYCQKALEIDPITQDAFVGLATVSILEGDPKTSKEYLLKASGCGKDNTYIKTLNGMIWLEAGDYKSAQQSFQEAIHLDEDFKTPKLILKRYFHE